jgi:hypothetical protein
VVEVRRSVLGTTAGYQLQTVEFADAGHGFAQAVTALPVTADRFGSTLFGTVDGGRSWHALADPRQPSPSPQLYIVDARTIVLLAESVGWYVSTDGGATFSYRPMQPAPSELDAISGTSFGLDCATGCALSRTGGPVNQPGLPGVLGAVAEVRRPTGPAKPGAVWAASLDGGSARAAISADQGRTWRRLDPPARPDAPLARVGLTISADGRDVWLIGYPGGGVAGMGTVAAQRRKESGVPLLWLLAGDRWIAKGTVGAPEPSLDPFSVAPIGGGLAAVQGHRHMFLVDDSWHPSDLAPQCEWVSTLRDGTVFATAPSNRTYYLGTRTGSVVRWIQIVLAPV